MNRKTTAATILIPLAIFSIILQYLNYQAYGKLSKLENIVDQIGVLFRDQIRNDINNLKNLILTIGAIQAAIIMIGLFTLLLAVQPKTEQDTTKRFYSLLLPKLFILLLIASTLTTTTQPKAHAEQLYYRPRATIPRDFDIYQTDEISTTMTIRSDYYVTGFTSYMIAYGSEQTGEFLEIGYCKTTDGLWIYSSQMIGDDYILHKHFQPQEGDSYNFKITVSGMTVIAYCEGTPKAIVELTREDTFTYVCQGETSIPYNEMNHNFTNLRMGYWGYLDHEPWYIIHAWIVRYTTTTNDEPYYITMTREYETNPPYPFYTAAHVYGRGQQPAGHQPDTHPQTYGSAGGQSPKPH